MANINYTIIEDSEGKKFIFDDYFNQPVVLPNGIHTITFGRDFNQPVFLPGGIHTVKFGWRFNQHVILPEGLHTVEFGEDFNHPIILSDGIYKGYFNKLVILPKNTKAYFSNCRFNQRVLVLKS